MEINFLVNVFELIKNSNDEGALFDAFLKIEKDCKDKPTMELAQKQIAYAISNLKEKKQMKRSIKYYQTLKNIAKIIESQYELKYILPIIGEMIDGLIGEHLIYIFLKTPNRKEYKLAWPLRCINNEINQNLLKITNKATPIITKNMGVFPIICDDKTILGAIVAHNHFEQLSSSEAIMLGELTKQAGLTITRAMQNAKTLKDATLDALTGLNNRRQFEIRLKQEIATANRQNSELCAIMLDIDFFKSVNDNYGHAVGDLVLKTVAKTIKKELREYDIPSRYGGEEFSIMLPHTNIEEASFVAERLRRAIEKKIIDIKEFAIEDKETIGVTISVGVNQYDKSKEPSALYTDADKALYDAKESGRNKVVVYSNSTI